MREPNDRELAAALRSIARAELPHDSVARIACEKIEAPYRRRMWELETENEMLRKAIANLLDERKRLEPRITGRDQHRPFRLEQLVWMVFSFALGCAAATTLTTVILSRMQ